MRGIPIVELSQLPVLTEEKKEPIPDETVFIDIKPFNHIITAGRFKENIVCILKYLDKRILTRDDIIGENIRYHYSLLVGDSSVGNIVSSKIVDNGEATYAYVEASLPNWVSEFGSNSEYYIRQFDGARYPFKRNNSATNIEGITYTTKEVSVTPKPSAKAGGDGQTGTSTKDVQVTFHIGVKDVQSDFPSLLDPNNIINDIYMVTDSGIKKVDYTPPTIDNAPYDIEIKTMGSELIENKSYTDLIELVVSYYSRKHKIDFYSTLLIAEKDLKSKDNK